MIINGRTKIIGILGYPVEHSLSPQMHNAAFKYLNLDYCYVPFPVKPEELKSAIDGIRSLNISGANITIPHKETVIPLLDEISEEVKFIGAVNTIKNEGGILKGYNTDGLGFIKSLVQKKIQISNKKVLILGAGGAARAIGFYLCKEAKAVYIYNRNLERAEQLSKHLYPFKQNVFAVKKDFLNDNVSSIDIIVNTTPLGLKPGDPLPMSVSLINNKQIVCDLIYKDTPFLQKALATGCKTINGLGMLLWQGALAFEIWTGLQPPLSIMKRALLKKKK
ncbi:MAG: shikimate dehydrogenase [Thermodesulfovibrionales bacterium]|nr:shikimate dehydrogenase [Thermodesulfovibrionales bacterium]